MQWVLCALWHEGSAEVVRGTPQRGVAAVASGVPGQHSRVQAGHAALQLQRPQVPHLHTMYRGNKLTMLACSAAWDSQVPGRQAAPLGGSPCLHV